VVVAGADGVVERSYALVVGHTGVFHLRDGGDENNTRRDVRLSESERQ